MMHDFIFVSEDRQLTLSGHGGAITSLQMDGRELVCPSEHLFTLYFRDNARNLFDLHSSEFSNFSCRDFELKFSGNENYPTLCVVINVRTANGYFYFRPIVNGIPDDITLDHIDLPHVTVPGAGVILYPFSDGVLVSDPAKFEFNPIAFPDKFYSQGYYPGICQMQFLAHYNNNSGLYFAAYDPTHGTKNIGFGNDGHGNVRLHLETFCGAYEHSEYISDFEYIIGSFHGNWMDAAEIYRNWLLNNSPALAKKPTMPAWMDESPVIVITPVRGDGVITDKPNEYFPYENTMVHISRFSKIFDSKIMSLLMRWDGNAPWAPPFVWPPMGGVESMTRYRDMLHAEGHLLGLYGSGTTWTLKSFINGYSSEEQYKKENLERFMTRGPHGEINADICHRLRDSFGMCISEKWCRDIFKKQVREMSEAGVDFIQLMDQNLGGCSFLCYSEEHSHPAIPGRWQTEMMQAFLRELHDEIAQTGRNTVLGTECAAAEPYVGLMPFNDLRPVFTFNYGMPIPVYQFVFHQFCNDFMGNQVGVTNAIKCHECPENMLWRIAYSFNAGTLLSVTLRDRGIIDWGAAADWNSEPPDQDPVISLICNLNRLRREYPDFLRNGKMIKPMIDVQGGKYTLHMTSRDETIDSFTHSCWESPSGVIAQIITNYMPYSQHVECHIPVGIQVKMGDQIYRKKLSLELPPLNAKILKISDCHSIAD